MRIQIMRKIDFYIGIPVCFAFSLLYRLKRIFINSRLDKPEPNSIVFLKFFGLGSIVLSAPAIQIAKKRFPLAKLYFLTFKGNDSLKYLVNVFTDIEFITIETKSPSKFLITSFKALYTLHKAGIDTVIDFEFFSRYSTIMSFLIRSKYRSGFYNPHTEGLYRGNFLTHKVFYSHYQHTANAFIDLIETLSTGSVFPDNKLSTHELPYFQNLGIQLINEPSQQRVVKEKLKIPETAPLIFMNPNCSEGFIDMRKWPRENFLKIALELIQKDDKLIVAFIGSANEETFVQDMVSEINHPRVLNLAGKTNLTDLLYLFNSGTAFITNDSGPAHLASLTNIPVITLFGPETPILYSPLSIKNTSLFLGLGCSPCVTIYNGKYSTCKDNQCLKMIEPTTVFSQIETLKGFSFNLPN